jgi:hypothetical protein
MEKEISRQEFETALKKFKMELAKIGKRETR